MQLNRLIVRAVAWGCRVEPGSTSAAVPGPTAGRADVDGRAVTVHATARRRPAVPFGSGFGGSDEGARPFRLQQAVDDPRTGLATGRFVGIPPAGS